MVCPVKFKFWRYMTSEEREAARAQRVERGRRIPPPAERREPPPTPTPTTSGEEASAKVPNRAYHPHPHQALHCRWVSVLHRDDPYLAPPRQLSESDRTSAYFAKTWRECHTPSESWPVGVQVVEDKLYQDAKLCVLEDRAEALLMAFDVEAGHPGINRLKMAAKSKFEFPDTVPVVTIIQGIRKGRLVFQASESPNVSRTGPIRVNPVVEGFFASVSIDVFSMPTVVLEGQTFDSLLPCVDDATDWILAKPTQAEGRTGSQPAHLSWTGGGVRLQSLPSSRGAKERNSYVSSSALSAHV